MIEKLGRVLPLALLDLVCAQTSGQFDLSDDFCDILTSSSDRWQLISCCAQRKPQRVRLFHAPSFRVPGRTRPCDMLFQHPFNSRLRPVSGHVQLNLKGQSVETGVFRDPRRYFLAYLLFLRDDDDDDSSHSGYSRRSYEPSVTTASHYDDQRLSTHDRRD